MPSVTGSSSLKAAGSRQGWPFPSSHFTPMPAESLLHAPRKHLWGGSFPGGFAGNPVAGGLVWVGAWPTCACVIISSSTPGPGEGCICQESPERSFAQQGSAFLNHLSSQPQPWSKGNCFMSSELPPTQTGNHFVSDRGLWLGGGRGKTCSEAWLCPVLSNAPSRGSDSPALFLTS